MKKLMMAGLVVAAMSLALIAEVRIPPLVPIDPLTVHVVALGEGVSRVSAMIPNAQSGAQYVIMGSDLNRLQNPVEVVRSSIVGNNGPFEFSGLFPTSSDLCYFYADEFTAGQEAEDSPNIDAQLRASPVIAPLSDGTPAFECVRDGDAVRVKVRLPKAMSGVTYELQGSPDVAFANPVKITSGSTNEAKGLELTGTVSETSCYFFRAVVEALKE